MSSEEPTQLSKYVLQDYMEDKTLWFETSEQVAQYLTANARVDPEEFVCFELSKEIKFKVVPA